MNEVLTIKLFAESVFSDVNSLEWLDFNKTDRTVKAMTRMANIPATTRKEITKKLKTLLITNWLDCEDDFSIYIQAWAKNDIVRTILVFIFRRGLKMIWILYLNIQDCYWILCLRNLLKVIVTNGYCCITQ